MTRTEADRETQRVWYWKNRSRINAARREWARLNPEKVKAANQAKYKKNSQKNRDRQLKRKYGIDTVRYEEMLLSQNGKCKICGDSPTEGKRLVVDHRHVTSLVRGLLCDSCNQVLGRAKERSEVLLKAFNYLVTDGEM